MIRSVLKTMRYSSRCLFEITAENYMYLPFRHLYI